MSCCGKGREAMRSIHHHAAPAAPNAHRRSAVQPAVVFEYTGADSVSVVGAITGIRYEFRGYGARLRVDLRDRPQLARQPGLRMVG
jgi:hypothetical protein